MNQNIKLLLIINNKKQTELQNYKIFKNILNFIMQIMRNFVTYIYKIVISYKRKYF